MGCDLEKAYYRVGRELEHNKLAQLPWPSAASPAWRSSTTARGLPATTRAIPGEKLQTISTKFRRQQERRPCGAGCDYYDVYKLLQRTDVQALIGSDASKAHKAKRFREGDNHNIAANQAFVLSDPEHASCTKRHTRRPARCPDLDNPFKSLAEAIARDTPIAFACVSVRSRSSGRGLRPDAQTRGVCRHCGCLQQQGRRQRDWGGVQCIQPRNRTSRAIWKRGRQVHLGADEKDINCTPLGIRDRSGNRGA